MLLHNSVKPPEKLTERNPDEKQITQLNQRISQLTESNLALKAEIERLKYEVPKCFVANEQNLVRKCDSNFKIVFFQS